MEALKSKTILRNLTEFRANEFALALPYLWIWNPSGIPPHMGLSVEGCYFSLKANGSDFNSHVSDVLELISRKNLTVLAVELNIPLKKSTCESEFSVFSKTIPHKVTCLNPIKNTLNFPSVSKLSELLAKLDDNDLIGKITSWNTKEEEIELAQYSTEDIHNHLVLLSK